MLRQPIRTVIVATLLIAAGVTPMIAVGWAAADIQGFTASTVVTVRGTTAETFPSAEMGKAPSKAATATQPAAPAQPQTVAPPKKDQPTDGPGTPATGKPSTTKTKSPTATATETKTAEPTATQTATEPPVDNPDDKPSN